MTISKELLDELLSGVERPEDLLGDKGLMKELKVRLMERMLGAELTEHLGYEPHGEPASQQSNRRNGAARKVLKGNDGAVPIDIPRDRDGSFEPELIQKGQTRIDGMDDKIIGLYAAGLSTRDIRAHLEEVYGLRVSADLISRVTNAVLEEVSDWQNRALEGRVASITGQARSTLTRENGQPTDSNLAQPSSVILLRARTPICASVLRVFRIPCHGVSLDVQDIV